MYSKLFSELQIANHTLKNRVIFCGPLTGFARKGQPTTQLAAYYLERAKGGVGLIELEPDLAYNQDNGYDWKELADNIHTYGTKLIARLRVKKDTVDACQELKRTIKHVLDSGFDGISLDMESLPKRQLPDDTWMEKLAIPRHRDYLLGWHLEPEESAGKSQEWAWLQRHGVNYVIVPEDTTVTGKHTDLIVGKSVTYAEPKDCETLLEQEPTDAVILSRQLVCDPYWVIKAEVGKETEIRPYCHCQNGCDEEPSEQFLCLLNPYLGQERFYSENNMTPSARPRRVIVLGGGPAGMQTAITASKRGHQVFLFAKEDELGGSLKTINHGIALEWLIKEMKRNKVDARIGMALTAERIASFQPDIIMIAMGRNSLTKTLKQALNTKGIPVIDIGGYEFSTSQAIKNGFNAAIGL